MNKNLVAVYGSLRNELGNNPVIQSPNTVFLGAFESKPEYSLYDLGYYPGLKENGETSVVMEVFEVDDEVALRVDRLEGYSPDREATFYDKKSIETPFGIASVYIYVPQVDQRNLVESGDWKEYYNLKFKSRLQYAD